MRNKSFVELLQAKKAAIAGSKEFRPAVTRASTNKAAVRIVVEAERRNAAKRKDQQRTLKRQQKSLHAKQIRQAEERAIQTEYRCRAVEDEVTTMIKMDKFRF